MDSQTPRLSESLLNEICDSLVETSWTQVPSFLPDSLALKLALRAETAFSEGAFREARIGRGSQLQDEKRIRSDEIYWLADQSDEPAEKALLETLEEFRRGLNERLFLGLSDFEVHFARYAPGASYGRHVDRFQSDDARTVSVVLYLNENWNREDGGLLNLYPEEQEPIEIVPTLGKMVCFMSAELEHEVIPSHSRPRLSLAAWFRRQKSPLR